jgi:hypothetical protein
VCSKPSVLHEAGSIGSTHLTITWEMTMPSHSEVIFEVQWRRAGSAAWAFVSVPATETRATKDLLTPATCYEFRVRAVHLGVAMGDSTSLPMRYEGPWSEASEEVCTKSAPPPPPLTVNVTLDQSLFKGVLTWRVPAHTNGGAIETVRVVCLVGTRAFALKSVAGAMEELSPQASKLFVGCYRNQTREPCSLEDVPSIPLADTQVKPSSRSCSLPFAHPCPGDSDELVMFIALESHLGVGPVATAVWLRPATESKGLVDRIRRMSTSSAPGSDVAEATANIGPEAVAAAINALHLSSAQLDARSLGSVTSNDSASSGPVKTSLPASSVEEVAHGLEVKPGEIVWDEPRLFVGSGGFGDVYRTALGGYRGVTAAVKELRSSAEGAAVDSEAWREQARELLLEIATIAPLAHPALVSVIGYSLRPPKPFVVTEFAACGNLHDAIHNGRSATRWTLRFKLGLLLAISRGLEYLHTRTPAIVHRDIKPANILLFGDPEQLAVSPVEPHIDARIADFGLARIHHGAALATKAGGTLNFTAPEGFRQGRPVTDRVDIYALGLCMFELLAEQPAWGHGVVFESILLEVAVRGLRPRLSLILTSTRGACIAGDYERIALRALGSPRPGPACSALRRQIEVDLAALIAEMWRPVASARPSISAVCASLEGLVEATSRWAET